MTKLSAILITRNEERHVARALESIRHLADEIIVVDSESTDSTVEIAKTFTPHVFVRMWTGYGPQKNSAREAATGEWILHLDADEEVSPELAKEIRKALKRPAHDFFWVPIVTEFLGRPLTHMTGMNVRLFRRASGRWDNKEVHEQIQRTHEARESFVQKYEPPLQRHSRLQPLFGSDVRPGDPDSTTLLTPLLHHSHYQTLKGYYEHQRRYTTSDALQMRKTGVDRSGTVVHVNPRNPLSVARLLAERAARQFVRKFFLQRGILDGWQGWLWCYVSAEYEVKTCWKYLRFYRQQRGV